MGREVKRVALDWSWPIDTVWSGYLNEHHQHSTKCPHCGGDGSTPEARELSNRWYGYSPFNPEDRGSKPWTPEDPPIWDYAKRQVERSPEYYGMATDEKIRQNAQRLCDLYNVQWSHHLNDADVAALVEENRLWDLTKIWDPESNTRVDSGVIPTAAMVNAWSVSGMGHDSINQWIVVGAEAKRLGLETTCKHCEGDGSAWNSPEVQAACEAWERTEPPEGPGYVMFETVTEGSPISPVFATAEELARYMAGTRWGSDIEGTSFETWMKFITDVGWAPSGMTLPGRGMVDGVTGITAVNGIEEERRGPQRGVESGQWHG